MPERTAKSGDNILAFFLQESVFFSPKRNIALKSFGLHKTDNKGYQSATDTASSRDNLQRDRINKSGFMAF